MSRNLVPSVIAIVLAGAVLSFVAAPVSGAMVILTPAGTKVGLTFLNPVDTAQTASGDNVHFKVAADVIVNGHVVIKNGTTLTGTVNQVGHPFPQNAGFANISALAVTAVDKKTVRLQDVRVSAPFFAGNIRVPAGTLVTTSTSADVTIRIP